MNVMFDTMIFQNLDFANIVGSAEVLYNEATRLFSITVVKNQSQANNVEFNLITYNVPGVTGVVPGGPTSLFSHNQAFEILGARPIRTIAEASSDLMAFPSFTKAVENTEATTFASKFPSSLNILDAIYLHVNVETSNYASAGFHGNARDPSDLRVSESTIMARIPFERASFDRVHQIIEYEDQGGDLYQTFLNRKQLDTLDFRVTDAQGRSLANIDPTQADLGLMAFRMTLRWDLFPPPPVPRGVPRLQQRDVEPDKQLSF
jgi:hypothetical protein